MVFVYIYVGRVWSNLAVSVRCLLYSHYIIGVKGLGMGLNGMNDLVLIWFL